MKIIGISVGSFIVVGILILMARIWGLGLTFSEYENEFLQGPVPQIIVKANTLAQAQETLKLRSDAVIWVDVRFSIDKIAFVLAPQEDVRFLEDRRKRQEQNPSVPILTSGRLSEYTWEEINEFYKTTPALREYYQQFPNTKFILNIVDNVSNAHHTLVDTVSEFKPNGRTFIQSDALLLMTAIKDLKPEWVYGTSIPDLMRMLTFDSMYILPSIQFKGDVFVSPFQIKKRSAFNDEIILEMRRQKRRLFLGPIQNKAQLELAQKYEAEGLITENLPELLSLLGQGPAL